MTSISPLKAILSSFNWRENRQAGHSHPWQLSSYAKRRSGAMLGLLSDAVMRAGRGGSGNLHSWLHGFRRLRTRFERRSDIHEAFLKLACALVCWNSSAERSGLFELAFKRWAVEFR
jgi:hypothetical protein